jgi:hypothetical protein
MKIQHILIGIASGLLLATGATAQPRISTEPGPFYAGGTLFGAQPAGEFGDYVSRGFGLAGHLLYSPSESGVVAFRLDGGFVNYGRETKRVPFSSTVGGRVDVNVSTTNNIAFLGVGPQLMVPDGRFRPYANGTIGLSYFFTQSAVEGLRSQGAIAETTNFDDLTLSYGGGAGVYVPMFRGTPTISLDLGIRYLANGETRYLREGSIRDEPDGSISFTPIRSEANFFTFHIGATVRLPKVRGEHEPGQVR